MKNQAFKVVLSEIVNSAHVDGIYGDGQAWFTRTQIGEALGYEFPVVSIGNIHNRHKERLDKFSRVVQIELPPIRGKNLSGRLSRVSQFDLPCLAQNDFGCQFDTAAGNKSQSRVNQFDLPFSGIQDLRDSHTGGDKLSPHPTSENSLRGIDVPLGGKQDGFVYNIRGVFEICRWSRQPKADMVMDALYDMAETVMKQGYYSIMSDEELLQLLSKKLNKDTGVYNRAISPALAVSDISIRDMIAQLTKDMGYDGVAYKADSKLRNFEAKHVRNIRKIKEWEETENNHLTYADIPDWVKEKLKYTSVTSFKGELYEIRVDRFPSVFEEMLKTPGYSKNLAAVNNQLHFNRDGYEQIINFIDRSGLLSKQDVDRWLEEAGLIE